MTADGAVPIAHRVADGNTNDDVTHIDTWDGLVALLGPPRLPLRRGLQARHPRQHGPHRPQPAAGSCPCCPPPAPRTRQFRDWIVDHDPGWIEAHRRPGRRQRDPDEVWQTAEAPWPSAEGHRVVWVRSSAKTDCDAQARAGPHRPRHRRPRRAQPAAGLAQDAGSRPPSPSSRPPPPRSTSTGADPLDQLHRRPSTSPRRYRQENRGRPGKRHPLPQVSPAPTTASPAPSTRTAGRPRRRLRRLLPADQQRPPR